MRKKRIKNIAFKKTIVAPAGKFFMKEMKMPEITQNTDTIEEITSVERNPLETCSAVTVGKRIRLEMSRVPTTRMPREMVMEVRIATR